MKKYLTYILSFAVLSLLLVACKDDKDSEKAVDYTELKELIDECNNLLDAATLVYYTQESIDTFKAAVEKAETFVEDGTTYQTSVTTQTKTLKTAKATFEDSALDIIRAREIVVSMNFDKDTIQGKVNTSGLAELNAAIAGGPKEIFGKSTLPSYDTNKGGKALLLKEGAHVSITDYMADDFLQTKMSFAAWVRIDAMNDKNYIASFNYSNNWQLLVDAQGEVKLTFVATTDGGATLDKIEAGSQTKIKAGQWAHIVVSLDLKSDEHKLTFYIDGKNMKEYTAADLPALKGTTAGVYTSSTGKILPVMVGAATTYEEATTVIGGTHTAENWGCLRGAIDNFAIYNVALSDLQVHKLYNDQK